MALVGEVQVIRLRPSANRPSQTLRVAPALWNRRLPVSGRTVILAGLFGAVSSVVEHYLDMVGVTGSIPVPPTIPQMSGAGPEEMETDVRAHEGSWRGVSFV